MSVDTPSVTIGAMAEAEDEVEDDGTTVALASSGVTDLVKIAGRTSLAKEPGGTSLARAPGGISLARTAPRVTQVFLRWHRQEGMMTIIRTRGLGAFRSHVLSLASWAELRSRPLSVSSSNLLTR